MVSERCLGNIILEAEKVKNFPPDDIDDADGGKLIKVHCGSVPPPRNQLPLSWQEGVNLAQTE